MSGDRTEDIHAGLSDAFRAMGMVTRWHLSVEVLDQGGDRPLLHYGSPDLRLWEVIGMLDAAATHARHQITEEPIED